MPHARARDLARMDLETPAFVFDELVFADDVAAAREAIGATGAKLLLAMKAFSFEPGLRVAGRLLDGLHASSLFEARLAREVMPDALIHTTTPGLRIHDVHELVRLTNLLSFNSLSQWQRFALSAVGATSPGIRVNPGLSFVADERYDPCARHSKLGVPVEDLREVLDHTPELLDGVEGLLVHTNCESVNFGDLLQVVELLIDRLDPLLKRIRWVNLGGGYLFREAEDVAPLQMAVKMLRDAYGVEVLLEPGTSLVMRCGSVVATVVDLVQRGGRDVAVLDTSVAHMPEVLEFQFVPDVAGEEGCHPYLLTGASCLAGDQFGEHCLQRLDIGSRVVIANIGAYSLVKASWFNGIRLPNVYTRAASGELTLRRRYTYDDFKRIHGGDPHARD